MSRELRLTSGNNYCVLMMDSLPSLSLHIMLSGMGYLMKLWYAEAQIIL